MSRNEVWTLQTRSAKKHFPHPAHVSFAVPSGNREIPMINTNLGIRKRAVQLLCLSCMQFSNATAGGTVYLKVSCLAS
jgi:hypothetical protein